MLSLEGKQLGNYDVIRRIRAGGMGAVYEGRQRTAFDRRVAIKVILGDYAADRDMRRRFAREAKTIARLHHPHILQLIEFGDAQGILYLVMPFIDGGTLTSYLRRNLPELGEVSAIYQQLLDAVEYAHEAGLIHRDIKSSNVLLELRRNAAPYVYLADFGLVRTMRHDESSQPGKPIPLEQVPGTPHYMAPEQTLGIVTPLTDIYALGVLLYQMLTGNLPYNDPNEVRVIEMHLHDPIPSPSDQDASIPLELDAVVHKAMAKRPEDRYRDVGELRAAFLAAVSGPTLSPAHDDKTLPDSTMTGGPVETSQQRNTKILNRRPVEPPEPIIMPRRAPRTDSRPPVVAVREVRERAEKMEKADRVYTTDTVRPRPRITEEPQVRRRRSLFPILAAIVSLVLILLLVLPRLLGISFIPVNIPLLGSSTVATVSITAQSAPIQNTFLLTASPLVKTPDLDAHTIPDRVIKNTASDKATIPTTGVQTTPGEHASGVLELSNNTDNTVTVQRGQQFATGAGISVQLQQSVDVPGQDNNGHPGQANGIASAVQAGLAGNIPANALKTTCCKDAVMIKNSAAFVGGTDPKTTHYLTQADLDGVQATISPRLQQQLSIQTQKQIVADEAIVGQTDFKVTKVNSDHAVNDTVDNVTVSINAEASTTVYKHSVVEQTAMVLLSRQAAKTLSSAYQLQDKPTLVGIPSVQSSKDGIVHLNVTVRGVWVYAFTDQQLQQFRTPIKGATIDLARTYLKTQTGIANVDIRLPFGTDHLPNSIDNIAITVTPPTH